MSIVTTTPAVERPDTSLARLAEDLNIPVDIAQQFFDAGFAAAFKAAVTPSADNVRLLAETVMAVTS